MSSPVLLRLFIVIALSALLCSIPVSFAAELALKKTVKAKVISIVDGDTLDCMVGKEVFRIRLHGIDAPERKQAFNSRSQKKLAELSFSKIVQITPVRKEKYGRYICNVTLDNNLNISQEMVRTGLAWWYQYFAPDDSRLKELEQLARKNKLAIWSEKNPTPPWEYRKQQRDSAKEVTQPPLI